MRRISFPEPGSDREEILFHPGNYIIDLSVRQTRKNFLKIVAVRFAFCYNTDKPCCAGWAGFLITLLHYPLFAYFPHTQDSQPSICLEKRRQATFF